MPHLLTLDVRTERDVVAARQRTRWVAELLAFDPQDQVRLATAVSEVARNAVQYARGGRIEFAADPPHLTVTVRDAGPGIPDPQAVLDGRAGPGLGLVGARRLMDEFDLQSSPAGTTVRLAKRLPARAPTIPLTHVADALARAEPDDPVAELQRQNHELLVALDRLRERETQLAQVNRELEETNRGVVALYAELDERAESLRRVSDLKTRFLSDMSHEFRTPLRSVLSLAQFLLDRADGPLTEEQEHQVTLIRRTVQGMSDLVNDLLDLAKVEAGKVEVRPERFRAADLFAALRGMMRPLAAAGGPDLVIEDPSGIDELYTDEGKVSQILRNFLSNALKFTERGDVRLAARPGPGDMVAFAVSDTGIGIAAADRERVFEEFGQVESPVQRRVQGTGLGLPLSRKLAGLLGGQITLDSEPGRGSTFTLTIPRLYGGATESGRAEVRPHPGDDGTGRPLPIESSGSVLVIDDDETARYLLRTDLARAGYAVTEAPSGGDGVRRARSDRPGAIVLDLALPDVSGFEVLTRLQADPVTRAIPVLIHTSRLLDAADRAALAGAAAILPKGGVPGSAIESALREAGVRPGPGRSENGHA
jgi:signal transduction histidine kinase/CheY-like chemotaxis protein